MIDDISDERNYMLEALLVGVVTVGTAVTGGGDGFSLGGVIEVMGDFIK